MKRWLRRLRLVATFLLIAILAIGFSAYFKLRDIVIWYANRGQPQLVLDLRRASLRWHRLQLSDVVLKLRENNEEVVHVGTAAIEFSLEDLREHRIGTVTLNKPHLRISDRLFQSGSNKTASTASDDIGSWLVQKFTVVDGSGEIDLTAAPLIQFSFAPEFHDLQLSSNPKSATGQQSISLEEIEFLSRGANPQQIGTISRIDVRFSQGEAEKLNFDELIVRAPSFHVTPEAVNALSAPNRATLNESIGDFPSFRIGKLRVENGELFIKDFGETIPEGSLKFGMETDDLQFSDSGTALEKVHALQLWDVRLAPPFAPLEPFAYIDSLQLSFTTAGLFQRKEIAGATFTGISITIGQTFRSFVNTGSKANISISTPTPAPTASVAPAIGSAPATNPWKLRELDVINGRVTFADLGVAAPSVGFNIQTTLKDIPLSAAMTDATEQLQQQEIADFTITSPLDSFAPVFTMKTLFIRYSIAGLLRREIEEIQVLNPTIYVGEDLFWYFDELSKREAEIPKPPSAPPSNQEVGWKLKKLDLAYGQLVIASGGKARLPLPIQFTTSAENLNLAKLSDLKLALDLKVPQEDYLFPGYKLELRQLGGNLKFDLPPQTGQNNLVQTLRMQEIRWRQFRAQEGWLSVTFDSKGINGQIGARGYGGYINGGFTSFFGEPYPWIGWLSGAKVDLKKITDVLAPGNFAIDGPADFKLEANGVSSSLERLQGSMRSMRGGKMRIGKLDQILAAMPDDWYWVKRELTRIVLETLRDFTYDSGDASFWFVNDEGNLKLTLQGPKGSRNIDVVLHGAEDRRR